MLRLQEDKIGRLFIDQGQLKLLKHSDRRAVNIIMFCNFTGPSTLFSTGSCISSKMRYSMLPCHLELQGGSSAWQDEGDMKRNEALASKYEHQPRKETESRMVD